MREVWDAETKSLISEDYVERLQEGLEIGGRLWMLLANYHLGTDIKQK